MVFEDETRKARKYKTKDSVDVLASQLAKITNPFSEGNIDDLLERLIVLEANRYNLLPEAEITKLNHYIGIASGSTPIPITAKPQAPRQENKSMLPLGTVREV